MIIVNIFVLVFVESVKILVNNKEFTLCNAKLR